MIIMSINFHFLFSQRIKYLFVFSNGYLSKIQENDKMEFWFQNDEEN